MSVNDGQFLANASIPTSVTWRQWLKSIVANNGQFLAKASMPASVTWEANKFMSVNDGQLLAKDSMPHP